MLNVLINNYDVIGHVVWQPCWKNFGPLYLWNRTKEKIETWHVAPHVECRIWTVLKIWGSSWDKMVHKKNWWRHRSRDSAVILLKKKKTFKNLLWSGWTDRGKTLQVWLSIHDEQKVPTYDVIGHMIRQPYCLKKKTSKIFSEVAEQIEAKLYMYDRLSMRNKMFTHMMS